MRRLGRNWRWVDSTQGGEQAELVGSFLKPTFQPPGLRSDFRSMFNLRLRLSRTLTMKDIRLQN